VFSGCFGHLSTKDRTGGTPNTSVAPWFFSTLCELRWCRELAQKVAADRRPSLNGEHSLNALQARLAFRQSIGRNPLRLSGRDWRLSPDSGAQKVDAPSQRCSGLFLLLY